MVSTQDDDRIDGGAEVVVIGGGSGGAVVAGRLAEAGVDVVLVEAGPDYGHIDEGRWPAEILDAGMLATTHDWGYASGPVAGRDEPWTWERARILGGCSAHNGAIAAVGHHTDYDGWHLPGWDTATLRPLFAAALERMRVRTYTRPEAGPFHDRCLDAAVSAGWPVDTATFASDLCDLDAGDNFGLEPVNVFEGIRWNTAFAYLDPVRTGGHLTIVDHTLVDRVTGGDGSQPVTVHAVRHGRRLTITADRVVLAAGVYGTPAILQRSGIGPADALRRLGIEPVLDLPAVGANLHDHPMVNASRALGPDLLRWLAEAAAAGFVPEEQTLGKARSSLATDGIYDLHLFPVCASTQTQLTRGRALVEVACVNPRSRGSLLIAGPDPEAHPRIDHGYLSDPEGHDWQVLRDGLEQAEELLAQPALRAVLADEPPADRSEASIRGRVAHYYHPVGTTAMGLDPATSVCDHAGRVHGRPGLVVADAAAIPTIPRANTNIPAVVVGERIAQLLLAAR